MNLEELSGKVDIHQSAFQPDDETSPALRFGLILAASHCFLEWLVISRSISLFFFLAVHIAVSLAAFALCGMWRSPGRDMRFLILITVSSTFLGAIGALGAVASAFAYKFYRRTALPFDEWFDSIFPKKEENLAEYISETIKTGREYSHKKYSVDPFLDVMTLGSEMQKMQAISRISDHFDPRFASALKKGLQDKSNLVRVQSAAAMSKIESEHTRKSQALDSLLEKSPSSIPLMLARAGHYDDYAFLGILDEQRENDARTKALDGYMEYLKHNPGDAAIRLRAGRLLIRMGHEAEACGWFRDSLKQGYASDSLILWYIESLYLTRQYKELREAAKSYSKILSARENVPGEILGNIKAWAGA